MKKTLALVLALAMVFSTITVAFAEDTLGADAQTCANLGMLQGETGTVDAAYVATAPTRLQAAIMFLRLKGLEAEALAFTGTENFADAGQVNWAGGKAIMAYLKANPQLGWQGDGTNFNPNNKITAQEYYKVLLESLGYKQTTPEVVGDFTYPEVITFAASLGLTKVAAVTNFTVNDLAIATVEALQLNVKDGDKTLAATLVEAGKIDKAAAIAAGLYADAVTTTDAKIDYVKALGNTTVLVVFDGDVEKAFADNAANFKVVEKGTTTALEVSASVLDGTEMVVLTTAAQTVNKVYTVSVGDQTANFTGISKLSGVPAIDEVEGTDSNRVVITFDKVMDLATALDKANYAVNNNVTVESVAWDDDEIRQSVELTTKGMNNSGSYKVTVTNVKSVDGALLKSASETFAASADRKAPDFDQVDDNRKTNTRLVLVFDEENDITEESAQNVENYKITDSSDNELEVISAKLRDRENFNTNDSEKESIVELTTASQKKGTKYEIAVSNLVDDAALANKMAKTQKDKFSGAGLDTDGPELDSAEFIAEDLVKVEFKEDSRLDPTTALDPNNYSIDNDIVVEKVEFIDEDDPDELRVKLYISGFDKDEDDYEITVSNVEDEYGNVMEDEEDENLDWDDDYKTAATIKKVTVVDTETVDIEFSRELDADSAEDYTNYVIDGDIESPKYVEYDVDKNIVTLTVREMDTNETYELTVNGVIDIAGNVLTDLTTDIVVSSTKNDTTEPEITEVEAINESLIQVTFDEKIDVAEDPVIVINDGIVGVYASSEDENDEVLNFLLLDPNDADFVDDGIWDTEDESLYAYPNEVDVEIVSSTAKDMAGNKVGDIDGKFETSDDEVDVVELDYVDQTSVRKFELGFDQEIRFRSDITLNIDDEYVIAKSSTNGIPYEVTLSIDEDDDDNNTILYIEADKPMDEDSEFTGLIAGGTQELATILVGVNGGAIENPSKKDMTADDEDEEEPYVDDVVAETRTSVVITFSEDMDPTSAGDEDNYAIVNNDYDDGDKEYEVKIDSAEVDEDEVTLTLSDELEEGVTYTLTVLEDVEDLAGNGIDETDYDFDGTDVVDVENHITGVMVYNGTRFVVYTYDDWSAEYTTATVVYGTDKTRISFTPSINGDGDEFGFTANTVASGIAGVVVPQDVLLKNTTYTVSLVKDDKGTATAKDDVVLDSYSVKGIVEDGDIRVTETADGAYTDLTIIYDDMDAGEYVVIVQNGSVVGTAHEVLDTENDVKFDNSTVSVASGDEYYVMVLNSSGNVIAADIITHK